MATRTTITINGQTYHAGWFRVFSPTGLVGQARTEDQAAAILRRVERTTDAQCWIVRSGATRSAS